MRAVRAAFRSVVMAGVAVVGLAVGTDAKADFIHVDGTHYSYQVSPGTLDSIYTQPDPDSGQTWEQMVPNSNGNDFGGISIFQDDANRRRWSRVDVQYQADPGYIFSTFNTRARGGLTTGTFFEGFGYFAYNWAFTNAMTQSPVNGPDFYAARGCPRRDGAITGTTTGWEDMCGSANNYGVYDFNNPMFFGLFDVNAASFSISIAEFATATPGARALSGDFELMFAPLIEAPVTENSVPAPGALALLGLGLFGIGGTRRKAKTV